MRLLSLVVIFFLCSSVVFAYPQIDYRSVSLEDQKIYNHIAESIDERHYNGVTKIIVYGKEMWGNANGIYFSDSGIILIDHNGVLDFQYVINHELTHNKCWKEKRDLSHDSQCFTNGLD